LWFTLRYWCSRRACWRSFHPPAAATLATPFATSSVTTSKWASAELPKLVEIATSVAMGLKLTIVVLDNRGFGCIHRLQTSRGGDAFNNLLDERSPHIDFAAHAASMGAVARKVGSIQELEEALAKSRSETRTTVFVIDTNPAGGENAGGAWWDVALPEVSANPNVAKAFEGYREELVKLRDKE